MPPTSAEENNWCLP